jgi:glutaredoxin
MKRVIYLIIGLLSVWWFSFTPAITQAEAVRAYFFYGDGCPHCGAEEEFLKTLKQDYPALEIFAFEVYNHKQNIELLRAVASQLNVEVSGVPFLVIGDQPISGYAEGVTSLTIEQRVKECSNQICLDSIYNLAAFNQANSESIIKSSGPMAETEFNDSEATNQPIESLSGFDLNNSKIKLPLVGEISIGAFSLPLLTILIGALDGFNPCAMWTLLFLISLLLGMNNKKRMWLLGSAFIVASALVYFLFMAAWLNLILFLGFIVWVRLLIGLVALGGGGYSLKEFWFNKDSGCKVTGTEKKQKTFTKLRNAVQQNSLWLALGGIILLAFIVNLVELICSAGLPAVYTQILALNNLATWQYYLYILLYVFFFMLDDLIIFFIAMMTLQLTGLTTKYTRWSRLIGGLLMLIIGLLLIFKPEWLMFG